METVYQLSFFNDETYPIPTYTQGQRVRVYDEDRYEIEGEIITVSVKRRAYRVLLETGEVETFVERKVGNGRIALCIDAYHFSTSK